MLVFTTESYIGLAIFFVTLAVTIFAFVSALLYSAESYLAAGKLNKPTWCLILGFAVVLQIVEVPIPLVRFALVIAALVYLADVRPALSGLYRRR